MSARWSEARRIPAEALAQRKAHRATLQAAREDAGRIVQSAQAQAQLLRQQGYEAGQEQARQQALAQQLRLAGEVAAFRNAVREEMAQVVMQSLHHVLAGPAREAFYSHFLEQGRQMLGGMRFGRLQVHAEDEARVRAMVENTAQGQGSETLRVEVDPRLSPGDCALVSEAGKVTVSLSARLEEVAGVLQEVFAPAQEASTSAVTGRDSAACSVALTEPAVARPTGA